MKKIYLLVATVFLLAALSPARAATVPGDLKVIDDERMYGLVSEVLPLDDGILVLGASEFEDKGWMAYLWPDGSVKWVLEETGNGAFRCASALGDGGFASLIKRREAHDYLGNQTGTDETLLAFISGDGKITQTQLLAPHTEWMIAHEDGYYLIGNTYEEPAGPDGEEQPKAMLTRLDGAGEMLWSLVYSNPAYSDMTFDRGAAADDSLIITGGAFTEDGSYVATIQRVDPDGQVLWNTEARAEEQAFISDICVTNGGVIAGCYAGISFDEEMGFPEGRAGFIFCMTLDGEVLWEHSLIEYLSADYIVPMADGFLVGSRGLDLENCPYLGDGWLLYLDESGNVREGNDLPDISGGILELMGMTVETSGRPLLYGALLESPGTVALPFVTWLDFFPPSQQ